MRTEEALDSIVDEVARRMTAQAPGDEFTLNVMRRVAQSPGPGRWRAALVLAPIAAAAIVMVFIAHAGLDKRQLEAIPPPLATSTTRPLGRSGTESPPPDVIAQTATSEAVRTSHTSRVATARMATGAAQTRGALSIEPMTVPLLHTPPLTTQAIPSDPINVELLEPIPLLAAAPLATGDDQRREK